MSGMADDSSSLSVLRGGVLAASAAAAASLAARRACRSFMTASCTRCAASCMCSITALATAPIAYAMSPRPMIRKKHVYTRVRPLDGTWRHRHA